MRLLICAGGTGGGVYPALAVLPEVARRAEPLGGQLETLWVGGIGGMEADLVKRVAADSRPSYEAISAAGVHGVGLRALPGNLSQLARGYRQSLSILRRFQPDVLFFTGGYVAVPMALAGRGRPTLLYVPDIEPGLALKTLARFADRIAVSVEDSRAYFPGRAEAVVVTGYPTRPELHAWDLQAARQALGLSPGLPTLLVTGGSKGARSINRAVASILPQLLAAMQVVHLTGALDWGSIEGIRAGLPEHFVERYHAYPYLHEEMGAALTAADLVVSRAGASALGEYPLFGLPAILVPYPYAWRYQRINAEYLERHGAARLVRDEDLPGQLLPLILELTGDENKLQAMRRAMQALAHPQAAANIADLLVRMAAPSDRERI